MDHHTAQPLTEPLVSILMLTYNRARFLKAAIESIRSQTYRNWQLTIVDDGSTDNTPSVIASCADPRITYIRHPENHGIATRRRESLSYATGTYTAVLDSDDVWLSDTKLEAQVAFLATHPDCAIVGTWIEIIDVDGTPRSRHAYAITDADIRARILSRNQFAHSSILIRTDFLQKVDGYRALSLAEDLDLFLRLGAIGTFANLPQYATGYREHRVRTRRERVAMAHAIANIIPQYRHAYPHYIRARLVGMLRRLRAQFM